MLLTNNQYDIDIFIDEIFTVDSVDNQNYYIALNPENMKRSDLSKHFHQFLIFSGSFINSINR